MMQSEKFSFAKRQKSFSYAFNGFKILILNEHNSRIHLVFTIFVVIAGVLGLIIGLFTPDWKLAFALAFTGDVAVEELLKGIIRREEG